LDCILFSGAKEDAAALTATNPTGSLKETKTTSQQTFKRKLPTENYFDVHKILGDQEVSLKIIGGPSTP